MWAIFSNTIKLLTNLATVDTVVDRIEVDTTSIESKVDIIDTNVDKIVQPKKFDINYSTLTLTVNVWGTFKSLSGRGILKGIRLSANREFRITIDGNLSTCTVSSTNLNNKVLDNGNYYIPLDLVFTSSVLIESRWVDGGGSAAIDLGWIIVHE